MHQKQPPPKSAVSVLLVEVDLDSGVLMVGEGAGAETCCEQEMVSVLMANKKQISFRKQPTTNETMGCEHWMLDVEC
jgi:hypothetical protein